MNPEYFFLMGTTQFESKVPFFSEEVWMVHVSPHGYSLTFAYYAATEASYLLTEPWLEIPVT